MHVCPLLMLMHHHPRSITLTSRTSYFSFNLVPTFPPFELFYFYSLCFSFYLCCTVISTEPCIITGHLGAVGRDEPAAHQMTRPDVGGHTRLCVPSYTHLYTVTPLIGTNDRGDVHFHHAFQDQGHKRHPKEINSKALENKSQLVQCHIMMFHKQDTQLDDRKTYFIS